MNMDSNKADQRPQAASWLARPPRWLIVCGLLIICGLAFGLRCLHLFNEDHYFIVSADSHYFHRMAQLLVEGETYFYPTHGRVLPIDLFSGITYPLAAIARGLALLTPASPGHALEMASKLLPPALGAATALIIYFAVSRLYSRMAGLFSAFAWAIAPLAISHQAAGYLDRDCLSLLLVAGGVFVFYFLSGSRAPVGLGRFNWAACVLAVVGIQVLLYVQWGFLGPVILLTILIGFFLLYALNDLMVRVVPFVLREEDPVRMLLTFIKGSLRALPRVLKGPLSLPIVFILGLNLAAAALQPAIFRSIYSSAVHVFSSTMGGVQRVAELQGIASDDIFIYSLLIIPALIGIYICAKRRNRADILVLAWFVALFLAGLFARRLFIFAAPAVCILAGLGIAALLDLRGMRSPSAALSVVFVKPRVLLPYLRLVATLLLLLGTILVALSFAFSFASNPVVSADTQWYDSLVWMREYTPEDAVIMTWWDYGYRILDIAQRVPVVDNGFHPKATDDDIRLVYLATDDLDAVEIMTRYGATHLIFSKVDTRFFPDLDPDFRELYAVPPELQDSLYVRSFSETFNSDAQLQRVYQSAGPADSTVVILALT